MSHQKRRSPAFSFSAAKQLAKPAAEFYQSLQCAWRQAPEFLEQSAEQDDKFQQLFHVLARVGVRRARFPGFRNALPHHGNRRVKFTPFALLQDHAKHFPEVLHGLKMLPPVAEHGDAAHDAPALQLTQASADVGTRDGKGPRDFLRRDGPVRKEQQGVDLRDRAINAPAGTHFSPMEDELLGGGGERFGSICHFCLYRNYSIGDRLSRAFFLEGWRGFGKADATADGCKPVTGRPTTRLNNMLAGFPAISNRHEMLTQSADDLFPTAVDDILLKFLERNVHDVVVMEFLGRNFVAEFEPDTVE
jgi:hypothetical protein